MSKSILFRNKIELFYDEYDESVEAEPARDCPQCKKGIVTIGHAYKIVIPSGILNAIERGDTKLYHYTCDRCSFKILTSKRLSELNITF